MEANEFVTKLKADGTEKDKTDLDKVHQEYKTILSKLPVKDRGPFSLNVLCILCRNLDKVPLWSTKVDSKALLTLSVDCVRETRFLDKPERVKILACIYHIHRDVVKQTLPPPELVLKISYMPFENDVDKLFPEYCRTYWNILSDRLSYIEKLKTNKLAIIKLLPKFIEDVQKVIQLYDTVQFCSNILVFLIKKLHSLYNGNSVELNKVFGKIFESLSIKNDSKLFKRLSEKEALDIYVKLNDCLYVIAENSSKAYFKESVLNDAVRICVSILGHRPDFFHCFQTFYLNSFCCILTVEANPSFTETILNSLLTSCEVTEKMGYEKAMIATYPFLNRFLRVYIEYSLSNTEKKYLTVSVQDCCLKLILFLMKKLENCEQALKCENCKVKTALHDSLQLSFVTKHFISLSLNQNMDVTNILSSYFSVVEKQQVTLNNLCILGCANYETYYKKVQVDIHNTAILLHKAQHYEFSIKLFDVYLKNEIKHFKNETELKNISRAFYNKGICELDYKLYEDALKDAYLSLIFAYPESLNAVKHMSLVMDVKAKAFKARNNDLQDDEKQDELQLMTVLNICIMSVEKNNYGNLKPFFLNLKFSELLKHEFKSYAKLWPSIVPIAGVWKSLYDLTKRKPNWCPAKDNTLQTLYEVVLETPTVVRSIHSEYYEEIVTELLDNFEKSPPNSTEQKILQATLLFLKCEYDLSEATQKYGWKATTPNLDPDQMQAVRTLPQEHSATQRAVRAVDMWTALVKDLNTVSSTILQHALQTAQVFVQQFLHLYMTAHGLQLAHVCCQIAQCIGEKQSYIRNAGTILYHANRPSEQCEVLVAAAARHWPELMGGRDVETALVFICDCAIWHARCGAAGAAARLVQLAQARVFEHQQDLNLELAVGRLMEAQTQLCKDSGPSTLSAVNGTQRHYLSIANTASNWTARRLYALTLKHHMGITSIAAANLCRALLTWRRARAAAGAGLPAASAAAQATLYTAIANTHTMDDAQTKIDNRLKHILGLQPSNETQPSCQATELETVPFTAKPEIETMLENLTFKKTQTSPSMPCLSVPGFKTPEFLRHDSSCQCYACQNPLCQILTCQTCGLEASMYFRAKEFDIAKNYFEGTLKCFSLVEANLKNIMRVYREKFESYVVDAVDKSCNNEFKKVQLEILMEAAFFELAQENFKMGDEYIIRIHEIIQEVGEIDAYLRNEVMNLMTASAQMRNVIRKPVLTGLEGDIEALKLSPVNDIAPPKTPEIKAEKPPKIPKNLVKDEEVPNTKRRPIKLNLDVTADDKDTITSKRTSKRTAFKIPVPVTTSHELENVTPYRQPMPKTVKTLVTEEKPSNVEMATPKTKSAEKVEFFTPLETPSDTFFTPMSNVRTYTKNKFRSGLVKNLENEFVTARAENKEHVQNTEEINAKSKLDDELKNMKLNDQKVEAKSKSPPKIENKPAKTVKNDLVTEKKSEIPILQTKSKLKSQRSIKETDSDHPGPSKSKLKSKPEKSDLNAEYKSKSEPKSKETKAAKNDLNAEKAYLQVPGRSKPSSKVETGSIQNLRDTRAIKRATSPGKLKAVEAPIRSMRVRKPVRFSSVDDSSK